jgi:hypothetical protein
MGLWLGVLRSVKIPHLETLHKHNNLLIFVKIPLEKYMKMSKRQCNKAQQHFNLYFFKINNIKNLMSLAISPQFTSAKMSEVLEKELFRVVRCNYRRSKCLIFAHITPPAYVRGLIRRGSENWPISSEWIWRVHVLRYFSRLVLSLIQ